MEYLNETRVSQPGAEIHNQGQNFSNTPPQNSNRNLKIFIGVLMIATISIAGFIFLKNEESIPKNERATTGNNQDLLPTFQNFASGRLVLYYNRDGIFQFDSKTQQKVQLVALPVRSYAAPVVLSPDNTKIVFYTGDRKYDLWLYDLVAKNSQKLLTAVELPQGDLESPLWAKNSKSIFITLTEDGIYKSYPLDLSGNKSQVDQIYDRQGIYVGVEVMGDNFLASVGIEREPESKRIEKLISCGDQILLGQVIDDKGQSSDGRGELYNKFYALSTKDSSVKEVNVSAKDYTPSKFQYIRCDANQSISKAYFQKIYGPSKTDPTILVVDLINLDIQTISYSDVLSQDISEIVSSRCVYSYVEAASTGANDFMYLTLDSDIIWPYEDECKNDKAVSMSGIYRLSKKENSISKIADGSRETYLIIPKF